MIRSFNGEYRWLSNFYAPAPVIFEGVEYPTVEHAYQAAKFISLELRRPLIVGLTPGQAKRYGKSNEALHLRVDWPSVRVDIMRNLLVQKFRQEPLRTRLIDTGDQALIEGNRWHDTFWGKCTCKVHGGTGDNVLGRLIMDIRTSMQAQPAGA